MELDFVKEVGKMFTILHGAAIIENITGVLEGIIDIDGYLNQGFDFLMGLGYLAKLGAVLVGGLVIILGIFELIKKLSKLIIVVAIIIGLIFVYNNFM